MMELAMPTGSPVTSLNFNEKNISKESAPKPLHKTIPMMPRTLMMATESMTTMTPSQNFSTNLRQANISISSLGG